MSRMLLAGRAEIVRIHGSFQTRVSIPDPIVLRSLETRSGLATIILLHSKDGRFDAPTCKESL